MKKIMFNDRYGLTEAVLSGRKTQTRRIIPQSVIQKASEYQLKYFEATLDAISEREAIDQIYFVERLAKLPYQVGEVVAVAQSYKDSGYSKYAINRAPKTMEIRGHMEESAGWNNKMFVRAEACKNLILITNVRVERLQDISDEDCLAEGVMDESQYYTKKDYPFGFYFSNTRLASLFFKKPQEAYAWLINKVCKKGTWESNPYVFVYDFELLK